jgi:hypothetical protein
VAENGERIPSWERKPDEIFLASPFGSKTGKFGIDFFKETICPIFQRELHQRGIVSEGVSYQEELLSWIEVV